MNKKTSIKIIETQILGANNLPISVDIQFEENNVKKPLVIFCHGFKGFKDWGAWNFVSKEFVKNDLIFLKFNFSHNGTTPENTLDFENLEAFSENNYSKELEDLGKVIEFVYSKDFPILKDEINFDELFLIGHSRGGGAVLVQAFEDKRIKKVATWAGIDSYNRFGTKAQIEKWKKDGVHIFINGRTGQKMPIKFQFYQDYKDNNKRLDIKNALTNLEQEILVINGTEDEAVHLQSAEKIASWARNAKLLPIKNANHVFGASHPFTQNKLPKDLQKVVSETISFFKK